MEYLTLSNKLNLWNTLWSDDFYLTNVLYHSNFWFDKHFLQSICDLLNLIRSEINVLLKNHLVTKVLFNNFSKLIILLRKLSEINGFIRNPL